MVIRKDKMADLTQFKTIETYKKNWQLELHRRHPSKWEPNNPSCCSFDGHLLLKSTQKWRIWHCPYLSGVSPYFH